MFRVGKTHISGNKGEPSFFWICTGFERNPHFHPKVWIPFETGANSLFQFLCVSRVRFLAVFELLLEPVRCLWGAFGALGGSLGTPLAPFGGLLGVF